MNLSSVIIAKQKYVTKNEQKVLVETKHISFQDVEYEIGDVHCWISFKKGGGRLFIHRTNNGYQKNTDRRFPLQMNISDEKLDEFCADYGLLNRIDIIYSNKNIGANPHSSSTFGQAALYRKSVRIDKLSNEKLKQLLIDAFSNKYK